MIYLVGFGADNCNAKQGKEIGVVAQLKKECPFLYEIGCVAHLLNLSIKDLYNHEEGYI